MKNLKAKIFFTFLMIAMLGAFTMMNSSAAGATYASDSAASTAGMVARTGAAGSNTYYNNLATAIAEAPSGATVTLIKNCSVSGEIIIDKTLTLKGAYTVTYSESGSTSMLKLDGDAANLTIDGAKLTKPSGSHLLRVWNGATLTVKGSSELSATQSTIAATSGSSTINISGGKISVTSTTSKYILDINCTQGCEVKLNISGGSFLTPNATSNATAVQDILKSSNVGKLTITLSGTPTFASPKNSIFYTEKGTTVINSTANITSDGSYGQGNQAIFRCAGGEQIVTIKSGTIKCGKKLAYNTYAGSTEGTTTVNIQGGTITTTSNQTICLAIAGTLNVNVTGGTISSALRLSEYSYLNDGTNVYDSCGKTVIDAGSITVTNNMLTKRSNKDCEFVINGGTLKIDPLTPTTASADYYFIYLLREDSKGITKGNAIVTITGGNFSFTAKKSSNNKYTNTVHSIFQNGSVSTATVNISGKFNTASGATGSFPNTSTALFTTSASSTTTYNFSGELVSAKDIFRNQSGTQTVNLKSGKIETTTAGANVVYQTFDSHGVCDGTSNVNITDITIVSAGATDGHMFYAIRSTTMNVNIKNGSFTFKNKGTQQDLAVIASASGGGTNATNVKLTVVIDGGTFDGGTYVVAALGGGNKADITVNGGTLYACKTTATFDTDGNSSTAAVAIKGACIYSAAKTTVVTVTGGTFTDRGGNEGGAVGAHGIQIDGCTGSTATVNVTGGTFTVGHYGISVGQKVIANGHATVNLGGNAKVVSDTYALVFNYSGTIDINITGGEYIGNTKSGLYLDLVTAPTASRKYVGVINMTAGTITGEVALNIKNTTVLSFTMSGGTLFGNSTDTAMAAIRNDNKANSDATIDKTYASKIVIKGTAHIYSKHYGIWIMNGAADIDIYGGFHRTATGLLVIGTPTSTLTPDTAKAPLSAYASTVNVYGGILEQDFEAGGTVFLNLWEKATINIEGFTAFGGRSLIMNFGKGTASVNPGSSIDAVYSAGAPVMTEGAGLRVMTGSNGIRFISTISKATVTALNKIADAGSVSYGTLIFPADYLEKLTVFTHDSIPKKLDIPAVNGLRDDGNGGYIIRAAIVNIAEQNMDREFVAIAYVKYKVDGVEYYRYAQTQRLTNARSMKQVARLALLDTKASQEGDYQFITEDGVYSRYTDAQRAYILNYNPDMTEKTIDIFMITGQSNGSGYSHFGSEFVEKFNTMRPGGYSHVLYNGYAYSASGGNPTRHGSIFPVPTKTGLGRTNDYMGAELGLAEALSAYYNEETGKTAAIIKSADGGTNLADYILSSSARLGNWTPPSYLAKNPAADKQLSGNQYRMFIELVRQTISYYQAQGYTVNVCGMFWMQGCAERNYYNGIPALGQNAAISSPTATQVNNLYTNLFNALVSDTRTDIGKMLGKDLSTMPVIAGSISEAFGNVQTANQTNFVKMQEAMVNASKHTYILTESRYLATGTDANDSAHYSLDDMLYIGQKLGDKFLDLGGHKSSIKPAVDSNYVAEPIVEVFNSSGTSLGKYENIAYAINTAPAGATVKLLKDVTLYGPLNLAFMNSASTTKTLNGNGKTIHSYSLGHGIKTIGSYTVATLNNVRFINHRDGVNNAYAIYMYNGSTVNITGANSYIEAYRYAIVMNQANAKLNMSGGTVAIRHGEEIGSAPIHTEAKNVTIKITGGTLKSQGSGSAIFVNKWILGTTDAQKTGSTPANYYTQSTVTITGGTFTPGTTATYAIYNGSPSATLNVSGATVTKGTTGKTYNAGKGTATN